MKNYNPQSILALRELMPTLPEGTQVLAGGTDWILRYRRRAEEVPALLWLGGIPELQRITVEGKQLKIGACCTMAMLERSDKLTGAWKMLAEAAASVGSVQIRTRATIGGNIANASPAADLAAPLMALDATAVVLRGGETVELPVSELIVGSEQTALGPRDIVLGFSVPAFPQAAEGHYYKLGFREELSISRFGVAMMLQRPHGVVERASIAIGAIGARAVRMPAMEQALVGRLVDASAAEELGALLADYIRNTSRRQYKAWASRGVMEDALGLFQPL